MEGEKRQEGLQRNMRKFGGNGYIHYLNCGEGFMGEHICQNLGNLKTLNMYNLLYVNYHSIKLKN